jgi:hypothetical protein
MIVAEGPYGRKPNRYLDREDSGTRLFLERMPDHVRET